VTNATDWPALPDGWRGTYPALQMWAQIAGKISLALTPLINHYWNITFFVTSRGLTTPLMPYQNRTFSMTFDFIAHQLVINDSDGATEVISLEPRTVADFYKLVMAALHRMNIDVRIWTMPVEFANPIRFEQDVTHRSYDAQAANAFWRILVASTRVLQEFRGEFLGKCSPVHFFWGSFDLAVTRFSGRRAPERKDLDPVGRESYSHEVLSHGFWPGSGPISYPAFYAYAAPEPAGFKAASVRPAAAFYTTDLNEFILPYEAIRTASSPESDLKAFLTSTYEAGANLAKWNRSELERSPSHG
jgi:Family of unknown function (DUF5996)